MNDAERLKLLVRALLPFALAAGDRDVTESLDWHSLLVLGKEEGLEMWPIMMKFDGRAIALSVDHLRAAADALRAAGHADALTDDSARAALGGEE